ncbi:biotin/lipoate--protein ligase family protein [Loktanella agnita]|uniref:biotin/lipoate--protein ligase family protein n=1 Tax=Loktanella agnita TaxID=287097 RepID=UPI0039880AE1
MNGPVFPPLLQGQATVDDPLSVAVTMAHDGCDAGVIVHHLGSDPMRAALILAPDVPLADAMSMLPACAVGFQNALGAIAPPEVAVHLGWEGRIIVNGAHCGGLQVRASTADPTAIPDWLVVGLRVPLWPASETPGDTPGQTALHAEGCGDITATDLLEAWARHSLLWISRWTDAGPAALHAEWIGLLQKLDDFVGADDRFGLLRRSDDGTTLTPLTTLLEPA